MKINGWKRIGVIGSCVWMVGAGLHTLKVTSAADLEIAAFIYRQCADIRDRTNQSQREYCGHQGAIAPMIDSSTVFNKCMEEFEAKHPDTCSARSTDYVVGAWRGEWIEAIVVALVPVPLAWGLVYLIIFLVRWVKRGFATA
jgi:hypothetical protein